MFVMEDDDIDLNAAPDVSPDQAERMVAYQRRRFSKSIEKSIDMAKLDEEEIQKMFPDGLESTLYGEGHRGGASMSDFFVSVDDTKEGELGIYAMLFGTRWDLCCLVDDCDVRGSKRSVRITTSTIHEENSRTSRSGGGGRLDSSGGSWAKIPGISVSMRWDASLEKYVGHNGNEIEVDDSISVYIHPNGTKFNIDPTTKIFHGPDGSYDVRTGAYLGRDGHRLKVDPSVGMYLTRDGRSMMLDMSTARFATFEGAGMSVDPRTGEYSGYDGSEVDTSRFNYYGLYSLYDMRGLLAGSFSSYRGSAFIYQPEVMESGYKSEFDGELFASRKFRKKKLTSKIWRPGSAPVFRTIERCTDRRGKTGGGFNSGIP